MPYQRDRHAIFCPYLYIVRCGLDFDVMKPWHRIQILGNSFSNSVIQSKFAAACNVMYLANKFIVEPARPVNELEWANSSACGNPLNISVKKHKSRCHNRQNAKQGEYSKDNTPAGAGFVGPGFFLSRRFCPKAEPLLYRLFLSAFPFLSCQGFYTLFSKLCNALEKR